MRRAAASSNSAHENIFDVAAKLAQPSAASAKKASIMAAFLHRRNGEEAAELMAISCGVA